MANTKVVTGKVRFSYCNIFEPREPQGGGEAKYSVTLLIPKSDTATLNKIKLAIADAREAFCSRNGANALPARPNHTLHDGDGMRDSGEEFGSECKGCYVITVSSKQKPIVVDNMRNAITDPLEVYSGCYGRGDQLLRLQQQRQEGDQRGAAQHSEAARRRGARRQPRQRGRL